MATTGTTGTEASYSTTTNGTKTTTTVAHVATTYRAGTKTKHAINPGRTINGMHIKRTRWEAVRQKRTKLSCQAQGARNAETSLRNEATTGATGDSRATNRMVANCNAISKMAAETNKAASEMAAAERATN